MSEECFQANELAWMKLSRAYQSYQSTNGGALPRHEMVCALRFWKDSLVPLAQALKAADREGDVRKLLLSLTAVNNAVNSALEAEATRDNFRPGPDGKTYAIPFLNSMAFFDKVKALRTAMDEVEATIAAMRMGL